MSDSMVSRSGGDTDSYVAHATAKAKGIDPSTSPRALMTDAIITHAPAPPDEERPASVPVIPPEVVQENLRRVHDSARNTLIRVLPDGKREYYEDRIVREGDGRISTVRDGGQRTDRGEGVTDSLERLSKEGKQHIAGLLSKDGRDSRGRFVKGPKS